MRADHAVARPSQPTAKMPSLPSPGPLAPLASDWSHSHSIRGIPPIWNSLTGRCYSQKSERAAARNWSRTCPFAMTTLPPSELRLYRGLPNRPCRGLQQSGFVGVGSPSVGQVWAALRRNLSREAAGSRIWETASTRFSGTPSRSGPEGSSSAIALGQWLAVTAAAAGRDNATICEVRVASSHITTTLPRLRCHTHIVQQGAARTRDRRRQRALRRDWH